MSSPPGPGCVRPGPLCLPHGFPIAWAVTSCGSDLLSLPELEPRGQQPVAKAEGSPTAILIGCLVAIILLLLLIIALMLWRLHWRRLLSKVGRAGEGVERVQAEASKCWGPAGIVGHSPVRTAGGGLSKRPCQKAKLGGMEGTRSRAVPGPCHKRARTVRCEEAEPWGGGGSSCTPVVGVIRSPITHPPDSSLAPLRPTQISDTTHMACFLG